MLIKKINWKKLRIPVKNFHDILTCKKISSERGRSSLKPQAKWSYCPLSSVFNQSQASPLSWLNWFDRRHSSLGHQTGRMSPGKTLFKTYCMRTFFRFKHSSYNTVFINLSNYSPFLCFLTFFYDTVFINMSNYFPFLCFHPSS